MNFQNIKSASGFKLLFVEDQQSPSIEISLYFKVGSRHESFELSGMAHLLEHLNFQGTHARPNNQKIVLEIENIGGSFDAFTSYEYTGYSIKSPANRFESVVDVLFDLVFSSLCKQEELEKEKNVILEEIKMYDDIPSEKARDIFQNKLFPNHNLGLNIAGTEETLMGIQRDDLLKFRNERYITENLLISVAGQFDKREMEELLSSKLESLPKRTPLSNIIFQNHRSGVEVVNFNKDISQANIIVGGYGLARQKEPNYALKVGNVLLSGGMGSMLYQVLREQHRLVYYINSAHSSFSEVGMFSVEMGVDISKINFAYDQLLQQLGKFLAGDFTDSDFERAKNYLIGLSITQLETSMDFASLNALNYLLQENGGFETKESIIKSISAITKDQVIALWKEIIKPDDFLIVNVGSKDLKI
jgi:predicted Zn-dependent peptidase